jgi:hypothetical protein
MKWTHLGSGVEHHSSHPRQGSLHLPCQDAGIHKAVEKKITLCRSFAESSTFSTSPSSRNMPSLAGGRPGNKVDADLVKTREDGSKGMEKQDQWGCGIELWGCGIDNSIPATARSPSVGRDQSEFEYLQLGSSVPVDNSHIPTFHTPCNHWQTKGADFTNFSEEAWDVEEGQQTSWSPA